VDEKDSFLPVYSIIINFMLSIVIQAGGHSSRMGEDKALKLFLGKPLIARVVERVSHLADELLLTTNHPGEYEFLGLPLFQDIIAERGALGGLYTALSSASGDLVAVVACDMPFVNPGLLALGRERLQATPADLVVAQSEAGFEPFHAVYRRWTCLTAVKAALDADKWRLDSWFSDVQVSTFTAQELLRYDPQHLAFWNLNTLEEFQAAEIQARAIDQLGSGQGD
jgi:molybdopterin-guanine dinucleotide biosynthesis protein A